MFPIFPNFKNLELTDQITIENFTRKFSPYNDFEFINLWAYNIDGKNAFSVLHNNLVIKIHDFVTGDYFYSFIGTENTKDTIGKLLKKSKEDNLESKLRLVPEVNLKYSSNLEKYYSIKEDPDSFDYILSTNAVSYLKGGEYHDKRNLVNRFKKLYPNHMIKHLDLSDEKTKQNVKELFLIWEGNKGRDKDEARIELIAIERLFGLAKTLKIIGMGIYIENKLVGFSIYHITQNDFAIISFEKGDISYKGIYEYLNHKVAKYLKTLGVVYINYEQDLGIPGLKKAKMLWRPVFFLKKYIIEEL